MKPLSAIEFRSRPMVVTVTEHCEHCKVLRPDVQKREHAQYWPTVAITLTSCFACFEVAKKVAIDEARAANASYC
jgi:hypothetical protein